jgi:hypothetical protein
MKPPSSQLNFTRAQQQQQGSASGHLSQISEDGGAFPPGLIGGDRSSGESSGAASRSFSGGFSIVGPWEESREIIATLGAYDPQVAERTSSAENTSKSLDNNVALSHCVHGSCSSAAPWLTRRWRWRAWTGT